MSSARWVWASISNIGVSIRSGSRSSIGANKLRSAAALRYIAVPRGTFSGRTFRANRTQWASFVVETPSQRIFLGGDGGYDTHFADVAREFPNLDVAVLEDGQYSEDWRYIHMLPADLKRAVEDLGARRVFPVHNSKYALARHPWDEPLNNAAALAAENPEAGIVLPRIGEPVRLDRSDTLPGRWWTAPEN